MAATKVDPIDRRERAAEMLAEGRSITAIAEELGVDRTNVWRWLKRPEVAEHYLLCVNTRAADMVKPAVEWMEAAFNDVDIPAAVKVAIARLAFERADKLQAVKERVTGDAANDNDKPKTIPVNPFEFMKKEAR
jgi:hypothetical protein